MKITKIHNILAIFIALGIIILDQITKILAKQFLTLGNNILLIPKVLSIALVYNYGAGFGILQNQRLFFVVISIIILGAVIYKWKAIPEQKKITLPLGLILGGLIGNLIDRAFTGYVTDFIYISHWPVFNVADSCITIGVCWMVLVLWKMK